MSQKIVKRNEIADRLDLKDRLQLNETGEVDFAPLAGHVVRKEVRSAADEARKIIQEAREEAVKIKNEASAILAKVEKEREESRKKGLKEGREEGLAQVSKLLVGATHQKELMFAGLERDIIRLVYDISEKIIGKELEEREEAIVDLIRQALHAAMGQKIVILVHPSDLEKVRKHQATLMPLLDASKTLQIRGDDKVSPKGCLIETEIGTIDAQLATQLSAIKEALGIVEESSEKKHEPA